MTIECTIRFTDATLGSKTYSPRGAIDRALGSILYATEADTAHLIFGGFFFKTDRKPTEILAAFEEDGFETEDFQSIEFSKI